MKSNIRKFMSMLMVSAMLLSLSTINAFAVSTVIDDSPSFERVECDHVEVLEDGGKIYTYVINGVVNKFPLFTTFQLPAAPEVWLTFPQVRTRSL